MDRSTTKRIAGAVAVVALLGLGACGASKSDRALSGGAIGAGAGALGGAAVGAPQRPATSLMTTRSISASRSGGNTSLVPGPAHQRRPVFLPSGHSSSVAFRVQFLPFTSVSFHPNNRRLPC